MSCVTANDIREFNAYLRNCTDNQAIGAYEKEKDAGREHYMALAEAELLHRGLTAWADMDD